jgi:hypothetical protein
MPPGAVPLRRADPASRSNPARLLLLVATWCWCAAAAIKLLWSSSVFCIPPFNNACVVTTVEGMAEPSGDPLTVETVGNLQGEVRFDKFELVS